jgi:hypothetical protein
VVGRVDHEEHLFTRVQEETKPFSLSQVSAFPAGPSEGEMNHGGRRGRTYCRVAVRSCKPSGKVMDSLVKSTSVATVKGVVVLFGGGSIACQPLATIESEGTAEHSHGSSGWAHSEEDNVAVGCPSRLVLPGDVLAGGIGPDGRGCRGGEVGCRDGGGQNGEGEQEGGDESVGHGVVSVSRPGLQ